MLKFNANNRNSFWLVSNYVVTSIFAFIGIKLNLEHYGKNLFDLWFLFIGLWNFGNIVDLGLGISLVKFFATEKGNIKETESVLATGFKVFVVLGFFVFISIALIAELVYFPNERIVSAEEYIFVHQFFYIYGIAFLIKFYSIPLISFWEGHEKYTVSSKINILLSILNFCSICICYLFKLSIFILAVFYVVTTTIYFLILFISIRKAKVRMRPFYSEFNWKLFKSILSFSLPLQGKTIIGGLLDVVIKYIIRVFLPDGTISAYEISRRVSLSLAGVFQIGYKNYFPKASSLRNEEEYGKYILTDGVELIKKGVVYSGFVFGLLLLPISLCLYYWYNEMDIVIFLLILSIPESINIVGYSFYIFLMAIGKNYLLLAAQTLNILTTSIAFFFTAYFFGSYLGLLGYWVSVIFVNLFLFWTVQKYCNSSKNKFLINTKAYKIFVINISTILAVVSILYFDINIFTAINVVSSFVLVFFWKEFNFSIAKLKSLW